MDPAAVVKAGKDEEAPGFEDGPQTEFEPPTERPQKIKIKLADFKERTLQHMSATMFWSADGKPMSAAQFVERLFGELPHLFQNEDELRELWSRPDTRKALLRSLAERGFGPEQLAAIGSMIDAEKSDVFDVLAYVAFALAPIRARSGWIPANQTFWRDMIPGFKSSWISCSPSMFGTGSRNSTRRNSETSSS